MTEPGRSERLVALDVFRGATIAAMILVNNPGDWGHVYAPLRHADWHGWTPTDLVFPFFLFIVGVAAVFALDRRREAGVDRGALLCHVLWRAATLFGLGLFLAGFPFALREPGAFGLADLAINLLGFAAAIAVLVHLRRLDARLAERPGRARLPLRLGAAVAVPAAFAGLCAAGVALAGLHWNPRLEHIRIPGVLQRLAVCYAAASALHLWCRPRTLAWVTLGCLLGYWGLMTLVPVPGHGVGRIDGYDTHLAAWLDRRLLDGHLWASAKTWDPEGVLSTVPALATALLGMVAGRLLRSHLDVERKVTRLLVWGASLVVAGYVWDWFFPINKKIWTSSYAVFTAGQAMCALALALWVVDVRGRRRWVAPFVVYGVNPITVFVGSGILARALGLLTTAAPDGAAVSWKSAIHRACFESWLAGPSASLAYACAWIAGWAAVLAVMYRLRIVVRV